MVDPYTIGHELGRTRSQLDALSARQMDSHAQVHRRIDRIEVMLGQRQDRTELQLKLLLRVLVVGMIWLVAALGQLNASDLAELIASAIKILLIAL